MKANINGFPELLPQEQLLMGSRIDASKKIYKGYGYVPLETSAVENMNILQAKGSDDKELYGVKRYVDHQTSDAGVGEKEAKMGLHFDLTIPFARYVTSNFNDISFPFKRYQIQKCRRGERPQLGRYREFLQADVDVVGNEKLPIHFDAEVLEIAIKALNEIIPGQFEMFFNNRKFFDGLCDYYGISVENKRNFIKVIDKLDKIGKDNCLKELEPLKIPMELSEFLIESSVLDLDMEKIKIKFGKYSDNENIKSALFEVESLIDNLDTKLSGPVKLKINLARGLDYYTGSIFEGRLTDFPSLSICGGGRYDNLTDTIGNKKLPGVGISLGLTRIFGLLEHLKKIPQFKESNSAVLIGGFSEIKRSVCNGIANILRDAGINTEVYHNLQDRPSKQIKYALGKGIEKILFVGDNDELSLKDLNIGEQKEVEIDSLIDTLHK